MHYFNIYSLNFNHCANFLQMSELRFIGSFHERQRDNHFPEWSLGRAAPVCAQRAQHRAGPSVASGDSRGRRIHTW